MSTAKLPAPGGCRYCGIDKQTHYSVAASPERGGWHQWVEPTDEQRLARMKARRAAKEETRG